MTSFVAELRAHVKKTLAIWPVLAGEVPLAQAHRLLDAKLNEQASLSCTVKRCRELGVVFPPKRFPLFPVVLPYLRELVLHELREGRLTAKGIDPTDVDSARHKPIAPAAWQILVPDYELNIARTGGRVVRYEIIVSPLVGHGTPPPVTLERWMLNEHLSEWNLKRSIPPIAITVSEAKQKFPAASRAEIRRMRHAKLPQWATKRGPRKRG